MEKNEERTYSEYRLIEKDGKEIARAQFDHAKDRTDWILTKGKGKVWILQGLTHDQWVTLERSGKAAF